MRLPRFFKKRSALKRKSPAKKLIAGLLFIPICFMLALTAVHFWFDDFTMLFFLSGVGKLPEHSPNWSPDGYIPNDWTTPFPTEDWQGTVPSSNPAGSAGLSAMYINSMAAGYYKEYLQVIKGHCDWTYMQKDNVQPLKVNGQDTYPPIYMYLGLQLSEGGAEPVHESASGKRVSPLSMMQGKAWKQDGKHTITTYNSTVIKEENGANLPDVMNLDLNLKSGGKYNYGYLTMFQISENNFPVTPTGKKSSPGGYYPSTLNGYGIAENTKRTLNDVDAGFYPDVISVAIQRSYLSTAKMNSKYMDKAAFDSLTPGSIINLAYVNYAYGEAGAAGPWGAGFHIGDKVFTPSGWNSRNSMTFGKNYANGMNWLDSQVNKLINALCTDFDGYVAGIWDNPDILSSSGPINHTDYRGMAMFTVLYCGGFTIERYRDRLVNSVDPDSEPGFVRGATIAYRALTGNKSLTYDDTRKWFKEKLPVRDLSSTHSGHAGSSADDIYVYYMDERYNIISDDGTRTVHPLHAYSASIRGLFMWRIGGIVMYYRMLVYSGIECTFNDAWLDVNGQKFIDNIGPAGSYYWGTAKIGNWRNSDKGEPLVNLTDISSVMHDRDLGISKGIHYGEDYGCTYGVPYIAMAPGKVLSAQNDGAAGLKIRVQIITEEDSKDDVPKLIYEYQHCSKFESKVNDIVNVGDVIAYCGSTGKSTGSHMHLNYIVYRGDGSHHYYLPYRAIYEGKCAPYNSPAVINGAKAADGYVYGPDISKPLGSFKANATEDRALKNKEGNKAAYYKIGLMRFLDAAKTQAVSRRR